MDIGMGSQSHSKKVEQAAGHFVLPIKRRSKKMVIETIMGLDPRVADKPKKTREQLEPALRALLGVAEGIPFAVAYTMLKEDEKGECRIVGFGPMTEKSSVENGSLR